MHFSIKYLILIVFILTSCTQERQEWSEFSVYDKAIDIDKYVFPNGIANQVFFKVKAQYPNKDVINFYKNTIKNPWVECTDSNNWESYGDISGSQPLFIHRTVQRWVNRDKNRLLSLLVQYTSQGRHYRKNPDNNIQDVFLIEFIEPDVNDLLSVLEITCNDV